jgi:1-acyl-sn-glycerol-3-phosphate acyltransferase
MADVIQLDSARNKRCRATTTSGRPCRNYAVDDRGYCRPHSSSDVDPQVARDDTDSRRGIVDDASRTASGILEFLRRRIEGDYPIDDFGYDADLTETVLRPIGKLVFERYFRVNTLGLERIPDEGPAMVVSNHSGTIPVDALMLVHALATLHPAKRALRCVGADLVWELPFAGELARKIGNVVACDEDAVALLDRGELLGVFPEGYKGTGKGWSNRYTLQRFGRGGYIEVALRKRVPMVPVAILGAEEAYPMIANLKGVSRLLGLPYYSVTPTFPLLGPLGAIPLPSKWIIEFGEPIELDGYPEDAAEDPMTVFDLSDRIRDQIQQMLHANVARRTSAFF